MKVLIAADDSPYTKRMRAYIAGHTVVHGVLGGATPGGGIHRPADGARVLRNRCGRRLPPIRAFFDQLGIKAKFVLTIGHVAWSISELARRTSSISSCGSRGQTLRDPSRNEDGCTLQPPMTEVVERLVGRGQRIGPNGRTKRNAGREVEEHGGVGAGEIRDGEYFALLPESAIGKGRDVAHVDAAADDPTAFLDRIQCPRNERTERREDDRRVERLRWPLVRATTACRGSSPHPLMNRGSALPDVILARKDSARPTGPARSRSARCTTSTSTSAAASSSSCSARPAAASRPAEHSRRARPAELRPGRVQGPAT